MGPLQTLAGPRLICVLDMQQFKDHRLFFFLCACVCFLIPALTQFW